MLLAARIFARHQPENAINARADPKRRKSCSSARISIAVNISIPRKQRNHTYRRLHTALSRRRSPPSRTSNSLSDVPPCDRSPADNRPPRLAPPHASTSLSLPTPDAPASNYVPHEVQPTPQQPLAQAMPTPLHILARVISRPRQIPHCLVREPPPLLPVSSPARPSSTSFRASLLFFFTLSPSLRGIKHLGHDVSVHARRLDLPLQRIATLTLFIKHPYRPQRLSL